MNARHRLANGLYGLAGRVDQQVRCADFEGYDIGDKQAYDDGQPATYSAGTQLHTRKETPVWGDFKPGDYVYAALHVSPAVTVFLNRRTTRKLLASLAAIDGLYAKHGEGRS